MQRFFPTLLSNHDQVAEVEGNPLNMLEYNTRVKKQKAFSKTTLLLFRPYLITSRDSLICIHFQAAFSDGKVCICILFANVYILAPNRGDE